MTVNYKDYVKFKQQFFEEHDFDYKVETSSLNENDSYSKTYMFEDGANWWEVMTPTYEQAEVIVKGVNVKVEVKMLRTEFWSTESESLYYYEVY